VGEVALTRSARFSGDVGKILLITFLLFVFLGSASGRQQSTNNSKNSGPPSGQISGHVYSVETGAPLAKAVVSIEFQGEGDNPPPGDIQTGADGSFLFTSLAPGKYAISVKRCGYISQPGSEIGMASTGSDSSVSLAQGEKHDEIKFFLVRGGIISGTVTDGDNEPVPGLLVEARSYPFVPGGGNIATPGAASTAYTDDLGNFRLIDLNSGSYFVSVSNNESPNISSGSVQYREVYFPNAHSVRDAQRVRVSAGSETSGIHVTVKLERAFSVRGHAQGPCRSVNSVSCSMVASGVGSLAANFTLQGSAREDGTFEIAGFFPGEYTLTAAAIRRADGEGGRFFGIGSVHVQVFDRDAVAEISVEPLAEISGAIVCEPSPTGDKQPPQISLMKVSEPMVPTSQPRLFVGTAPQGNSANSRNHFDMQPGTYLFTLTALRVFMVEGSVVQLNNLSVTDTGLMYLKEVNCGGRDYAKEAIELGSGTRLDDCKVKIGHDTASINGKVMDGDKGIAGQIVVAIPESPELRRNPRYTLAGRTNREGQFSITGIIPGDYLIFAVTPNEEQSYYAPDFAERNSRDAERATFKPGEAKVFVLKPSSAQ